MTKNEQGFRTLECLHVYKASKVKHHLYICYHNFQTTVKKFYRTWKIFICCETRHKYLNKNLKIHLIFQFCYKIMSFRDLSTLLLIALKSSGSNPQHIETNFVPFSYKIFNINLCTQSCNENNLTPMCFLLNSQSHSLAK